MKDYYSIIAKGYNQLYKKEQLNKLKIIKEEINISGLVLDIGCGTGISSQWENCIGIDPAIGMLKLFNGQKICAKAEALPFINKTFDMIISLTALHHITDIKQTIKEIKRVGKPQAKLALTILKKSQKSKNLIKELTKNFKVKIIEEEKDYILIGKIS